MVDRSEIDQMAKFMAALNPAASTTSQSTSGQMGDASVVAMKNILERFHAAADNVLTEASYDRDLREAMIMESTDHGARIGSWEIRVNESGRHRLYDVVSAASGEAIAVDLLLYEAARGLVRILNDGGRINSPTVVGLLRAEQEYGGLVHDMTLYKYRMTHNPDSRRAPVYEARYTDAKQRASQARDRVCKLAEAHYR